jgi:threonine synthase
MSILRYRDTRGGDESGPTFGEVILTGTAPGGGLYVPERSPTLPVDTPNTLVGRSYAERVGWLLELFATGLDPSAVRQAVTGAYTGSFTDPAVTPVVTVDTDLHLLELWHGPTGAFKDLALQLLPRLMTLALGQVRNAGRPAEDLLVLVATSGDTGGAALAGFADRPSVRIAVFYPEHGTSALQRLQMVTQPGGNVLVCGVRGDFDDCQRAVKAAFADQELAERLREGVGLRLTSANSINWGRLLPQVAYYLSAWTDLVARGALPAGTGFDVCVPTGNFGDILAAWYARRIGVPILRLLCASNDNRVLSDFFTTGFYDLRDRKLMNTPSPAMDILVSSNLERLLYEVTGDPDRVAGWFEELGRQARFEVDPETRRHLASYFLGDWVDAAECLRTIRSVWECHGRLIDPHTAVAWRLAERHRGRAPMLVVGTAHWAKFAPDVRRALCGEPPVSGSGAEGEDPFAAIASVQELTGGVPVPPALSALAGRTVRFDRVVEATPEAVQAILLEPD